MDPIKEAFRKAKHDIFLLQSQIQDLKNDIKEIKRTLDRQTDNQTDRQTNQTYAQNPYQNSPLEAPKPLNLPISTGNRGVQTDRQTIRQTDRQTQKFAQPEDLYINRRLKNSPKFAQANQNPSRLDHLDNVSKVLNSLDSLKKEIRSKFQKLTNQEMLIFSSIYQLEEEGLTVDYPLLSSKLSLSESSIRDYVQKLIKKGVPVVKTKHDNKKITLSILPDLKKMASLQTILQLRAIKI